MSQAEAPGTSTREQRLVETFVELADNLVDDFDVVEVLHVLTTRCVELLDVSEAGIVLADLDGTLRVVASSNEQTHVLELFQLQSEQGPCLECVRTGEAVVTADLEADRTRWPDFAPAALASGFASIYALPMHLRGHHLGALNLFRQATGQLNPIDVSAATAMADIATISLLQERTIREAHVQVEQLQRALRSRIVIEQAKGILAEQAHVDVDESFDRLRAYARSNNRKLGEVAMEVVEGLLDHQVMQDPRRPRPSPGS